MHVRPTSLLCRTNMHLSSGNDQNTTKQPLRHEFSSTILFNPVQVYCQINEDTN